MRVAIAHPDLGLGGAERLIVDAAQTLCDRGHEVVVYTARHDPARCFEETRSGAFKVVVRGGWIPRHVFGRLHALCAYARCVWLAMCLALALRGRVDAVLCDQVSAMVPVLHALLWRSAPTLFYCHFPDMLLASRATLLRRLYRAPVDCVEQASTGCASTVLVNSRYTGGVFAQTFAALHARGLKPKVLYPAVDLAAHAPPASTAEKAATERCVPEGVLESPGTDSLLLSINRFERKKGLKLAIDALGILGRTRGSAGLRGVRLCFAGGYDPAVRENVEHLEELRAAASAAGVSHLVSFVPNFSAMQRRALLSRCVAVLYTPEHEHFGIVPLEAMAAARPVVACNSGGPVETVVHGRTGLLCEPTAEAFASALGKLLDDPVSARAMGAAARAHVSRNFSRRAFGKQLEGHIRTAVDAL